MLKRLLNKLSNTLVDIRYSIIFRIDDILVYLGLRRRRRPVLLDGDFDGDPLTIDTIVKKEEE